MPEGSSDDSLEWLSEGSPASSSEGVSWTGQLPPFFLKPVEPSEPDETVELYRTVSFVPLAIVLLALALLSQAIAGPSALEFVVVLSASAIATALIGTVKRSRVLPLEDSEAGDEES